MKEHSYLGWMSTTRLQWFLYVKNIKLVKTSIDVIKEKRKKLIDKKGVQQFEHSRKNHYAVINMLIRILLFKFKNPTQL